MSLNNPNKPVTEARLAEFYQALLPYLGGMPEIVASKFDRSDIYSTNERMIGQWIDGKPLYQRVYTGLTIQGSPNVQTIKTLDFDVDNLIDCRFHMLTYAGNRMNRTFPDTGTALWMQNNRDIVGIIDYANTLTGELIINYTKTTDSAISIGSDTDYSTEEKIIGTWINGKPLYQKTVSIVKDNDGVEYTVPHNIDSPVIVGFSCMFVRTDGTTSPFPFVYVNSSGSAGLASGSVWVSSLNVDIRLKTSEFNGTYGTIYTTLQYTKTTD